MAIDSEFDIAILGDDPLAKPFLKRACQEFGRVLWVSENLEKMSLCGLTQWIGQPRFESPNRVRVDSNENNLIASVEHSVIAVGAQSVRPGWMIDHPLVFFAGEKGKRTSCSRIAYINDDKVELLRESPLGCSGQPKETVQSSKIAGLEEHPEGISLIFFCGRSLVVDSVIVEDSRFLQGNTKELNLETVGLVADDRGRIWCNENYETWTPGVYALGDVIGFPSPVAAPEEQIAQILNKMLEDSFVMK